MTRAFTKWLAALLALCLLTALAPAALMEEAGGSPGTADEATAVNPSDGEAADESCAPDGEIVSETIDETVEEVEIELDDVPVEAADEVIELGDAPESSVELTFENAAEAPPFLAAPGDVPINAATFPDHDFMIYVSEKYDGNGDGYLSKDEADAVTGISLLNENSSGPDPVPEIKAASLKGIECFPNLTHLYCTRVGLTSLDVSANTQLKVLEVVGNSLASLDVSHNPNLEELCVSMNKLTSLNVGTNAKLKTLLCDQNQLTALDVTHCSNLSELQCYGNKLTKLDISKCPAIANHVKGEGTRFKIGACSVLAFEGTDGGSYCLWLECDDGVQLIGGSAIVLPTIKVPRKSVKATVNVGQKYRIDLSGATAKSFKSSKKKVATVDKNGVVTPKAPGKAKITIKIGKKKRTLTLTVKDPTIPNKVTLNMAGTVAAKKGTSVTLTATLPAGTSSGIKWKSSNKKIATVNNGVVTFKKKGKVTITATAVRGKKKAKVKFKVSN